MPQFPGGIEKLHSYLQSELQYPVFAQLNAIEGKVFVKFVVLEDGSITDLEIARTPKHSFLAQEALRVVKNMPKWTPGYINGKPVKVYFNLPITFRLDAKHKERVSLDTVAASFDGPRSEQFDTFPEYKGNLKEELDWTLPNATVGRVYLLVTIDTNGTLTQIRCLRQTISDLCTITTQEINKASTALIKPGNWVPAMRNGHAVPCDLILEVGINY